MSLPDAILAIVEGMEEEAKEFAEDKDTKYIATTLRGYAKQLKVAVKASEGAPALVNHPQQPDLSLINDPIYAMGQQRKIIEDMRAQIRLERNKTTAEEGTGEENRYLVGGAGDGDAVRINSSMPANGTAHMPYGGEVYTRQADGNLHFNPEVTEKWRQQKQEKDKGGIILG